VASCQSNAQAVGELIVGGQSLSGVARIKSMSLSARMTPAPSLSPSALLKGPPC
jgi:hypothetical protein